jgi:hypothetical protein
MSATKLRLLLRDGTVVVDEKSYEITPPQFESVAKTNIVHPIFGLMECSESDSPEAVRQFQMSTKSPSSDTQAYDADSKDVSVIFAASDRTGTCSAIAGKIGHGNARSHALSTHSGPKADLPREEPTSVGDCPALMSVLSGTVTVARGNSLFMESAPGVSDVYISAAAAASASPPVAVGQVRTVEAVPHQESRNRWKVLRFLDCPEEAGRGAAPGASALAPQARGRSDSASMAVQEPGGSPSPMFMRPVPGHGPRVQGSGDSPEVPGRSQPEHALASPAQQAQVTALVGMGFPAADAREALRRSGYRLDEAVELLLGTQASQGDSSGAGSGWTVGTKKAALARPAGHTSEDGGRGVGRSLQEAHPSHNDRGVSESGSSVVDRLVGFVAERGGQVVEVELSRFLDRQPDLQAEVARLGGMKGFCARHQHALKFKNDRGSGIISCGSRPGKTGGPDSAASGEAGGVRRITGAITKMHQGSFFMESSQGTSDVYVPADVRLKWPGELKEGCVVTVAAVEHRVGKNRWKATTMLPRAQTARPKEDSAVESAPTWRFTGPITKKFQGALFVESAPGVSDIFVPQAVVASLNSKSLAEGCMITAVAVPHVHGECRWRALQILLPQTARAIPVPAAPRPETQSSWKSQSAARVPKPTPTGSDEAGADKLFRDSAAAVSGSRDDLGGTGEWSVVQCLLAMVRKNGFLQGSDLSSLYRIHPEAAVEVKQAGGLRGFCAKYRDQIEFEHNGGSGRVIAKIQPVVIAAPISHASTVAAPNIFAILGSDENETEIASSDDEASNTVSSEAGQQLHVVSELLEMGFEEQLASEALKRTNAKVAEAVDWIYDKVSRDRSGADPSDEESERPGHAAKIPLNAAKGGTIPEYGAETNAHTAQQTKASKRSPKDAASSAKATGDMHMQQWKYSAGRDAYTLAIFHYLDIPCRSTEVVADIGSSHVSRAIACFKSENYLEAVADCVAATNFGISRSTIASLSANSRLILCEKEGEECFKMYELVEQFLLCQTPATVVRKKKLIDRATAALAVVKLARQDAFYSIRIDLGKYVNVSFSEEYTFCLVDNFWQRISLCEIDLQQFNVACPLSEAAQYAGNMVEGFDGEDYDDDDDISSAYQYSEGQDDIPGTLRVVCPDSVCHAVLVMSYDKKFHAGWGKVSCWLCSREYLRICFVELAQQGLPDILHSIWTRASKALTERQGSCGEQFVEDSRLAAVRYGLDILPQYDRYVSTGYDFDCGQGIGADCPGRAHSGTKLLLSHCVNTGNAQMLAFFTQFPKRLENSNDFCAAFDEWVSKGGSWLWYFLQAGGLELALDFDEHNSSKSFKNSLSYTVCSSVLQLMKDAKRNPTSCSIGTQNLFSLLEIILDVPELASKKRVDLAVSVVTSLAKSEISQGYELFSSFVSTKRNHVGSGIMALACKTRRYELVSAILNAYSQLVNVPSKGSFQALHSICCLPPLNACLDLIFSFPLVKKEADFSSFGFHWKVHLSSDICGQNSATVKQKESTTVPAIDFCLSLEECRSFCCSMLVQVELKIEIFADVADVAQSTLVRACSFSHRDPRTGPLRIPIAESLLDGGAARDVNLCVRVTVSKLGVKGCADRHMRSVDKCARHQLKIINLLLANGADRDAYTSSGHNAFSLALINGLPDSILQVVFPRDVVRATNTALARNNSSVREISNLLGEISAEKDGLNIRIAGLVEKLVHLTAGTADHTTLFKALEKLLKAGVGPDDFSSAVRLSIEHRDWISAELLVQNAVDDFSAKGIQLHAVIMSHATLVQRLLELGACANETRKTANMDSETPLHVAARLGSLPVMELLLKFKGDCNFKDTKSGITPLHEAALWLSGPGGEKFIRVMLNGGADPGVLNEKKLTPSGCTKDRQMKKVLDEFEIEMKSSANISKAHSTLESSLRELEESVCKIKILAVQPSNLNVALPLHRPVLEPIRSRIYNSGIIDHHKQIQDVTALNHNVRVANIYQVLDGYQQGTKWTDGHEDDCTLGSSGEADGTKSMPLLSSTCMDIPQNLENLEDFASRIEGSVWDIRFTRDFKERLFQLASNPGLLVSLFRNLSLLAQGHHSQELVRSVQHISQFKEIFQSPMKKFDEGPSFVWQIAPDYSPRIRGYTDTIRLWRLCCSESEVVLPA